MFQRRNFVELGCHVLLFGYFLNGIVVHEDSMSFPIDLDGLSNNYGVDPEFYRNTAGECFYSSLHQIYSPKVLLCILLTILRRTKNYATVKFLELASDASQT